ncbi:MAG: hypothetical protein ABIY37_08175 [Devosia sp.]
MATYAFMSPVLPGKLQTWMHYVREMKSTYQADLAASRRRMGLTKEEVWLEQMPTGAYAVVYWEAPDIAAVYQQMMTSDEPIDRWFRDRILVEVHGINPAAPPPPMNEKILG